MKIVYFVCIIACISACAADISEFSDIPVSFKIHWNISKSEFYTSGEYFCWLNVLSRKKYVIGSYSFDLCLTVWKLIYRVYVCFDSKIDINYHLNQLPPELPPPTMNYHLKYSYVTTKHEIFHLAESQDFPVTTDQLTTENIKEDIFINGYTTIYTGIVLRTNCLTYSLKTQSNYLWPSRVKLLDSIDENKFSGHIPALDVGKAKEIFSRPESDLSVFAVTFLMQHITEENVLEILDISTEYGISVLSKKCVAFLKYKQSALGNAMKFLWFLHFILNLILQYAALLLLLFCVMKFWLAKKKKTNKPQRN